MKSSHVFCMTLLSSIALVSVAQQSAPDSPQVHASAQDAPSLDVVEAAQPAVQVVDAFSTALAKGNMSEVERLLDSDVLILEGGGAEHSRAEYLSHHAIADAKFLGDAHSTLLRRTARAQSGLAWIASESELRVSRDGKPIKLRSTETMILRSAPEGWRIVHIHWSSKSESNKGE
jgi:hypothetical protein